MKVFDTLLSEDELKSAAKSIGLFAIDHLEEDTQRLVNDNHHYSIFEDISIFEKMNDLYGILFYACITC